MTRRLTFLLALVLLLATGAPAHAARQSFFHLACDPGVQGQLAYTIQYEHYALVGLNYCLTGVGAQRPWVFAKASDGKVLGIHITVIAETIDGLQKKTCTLVNGAQALRCQFPSPVPLGVPLEVLFEYAIGD